MKEATIMQTTQQFSTEVLKLDAARTAAQIEAGIRDIVFHRLKRKGAVLGISGGIDSSVVAALCVRALGKDRVAGLFMPEADSSGDSLRLGEMLAASLGIRTVKRSDTRKQRLEQDMRAEGARSTGQHHVPRAFEQPLHVAEFSADGLVRKEALGGGDELPQLHVDGPAVAHKLLSALDGGGHPGALVFAVRE